METVLARRAGRPDPWVLAGVAYLGLALLVLAPALATFARAVPGGAVAAADGWQNVWNLWWTHRALMAGESPFYTRMIFYPEGADLTGQTLSITNGLLALPVTALFGPVAGYNFTLVTSFVLAGLGGYALAREVTGRPAAAFVGGLVLAFGPFHMTKVWDGQLELIAIHWLPLYVLFLVRAAGGRGQWRDALLAGALLAVVGYTSWYYLYFMAVASLMGAALWLPWRAGPRAWLRGLGRLALAALVGAALLAPAIGGLLRSALAGTGPSASTGLLPERSATLLDFWLPSYLHPLMGPSVLALGSSWHAGVAAWNVALGYTPVLLALVALWRAPRAAWRWAALAGAACLLALGPWLAIGPWQTGVPLPYAALAALPGGNLSHRPGHFVVIACVAMVPLVALGLSVLLDRAEAWRGGVGGRDTTLPAASGGPGPAAVSTLLPPTPASPGDGVTIIPAPLEVEAAPVAVAPASRPMVVRKGERGPFQWPGASPATPAPAEEQVTLRGLGALLDWAGAPLRARSAAPPPLATGAAASPWGLALIAAVLLALGWEFLPPRWELWEPETHPYYLTLAAEPGALLVLPAGAEDVRPMIDQLRHGRPLLGGFLARAPNYDPPRAPGVRELWRPAAPAARLLPSERDQGLAALRYYGVSQIAVERARLTPEELAALEGAIRWLLPEATARYEDEALSVYDVPAASPRAFAFFRRGWYREERDGERAWRWMREQGELILVNPDVAPRPVALSLSAESYRAPRELAMTFGGAAAGALAIPAQPGRVSRVLHLLLPPGETALTLAAPVDPQPSPDKRSLSIVLTDAVVRQRAEE